MISKKAKIGKGTVFIAPELSFIEDCQIGENCKIHEFVTIQGRVKIGNLCKIEQYAFIPAGVTIGNKVFIGQGVCFTNDKYPKATIGERLQKEGNYKQIPTVVKNGASVGSNATIICGITIGKNALVGAGSVVTKDVPDNSIVAGNPAKIIRKTK